MGSTEDVCRMTWVILVTLHMGDPFFIQYKEFPSKKVCVDYVSNSNNADTLAIEVIAVAGFNDPVIDISCVTRREG